MGQRYTYASARLFKQIALPFADTSFQYAPDILVTDWSGQDDSQDARD
jgi:hypothetical protein